MEHVLTKNIDERSSVLYEAVKEKASAYVYTKDFFEAKEKLDQSHALVITGEAGIGKTTLSNMLAFEHVKEGYRFLSIRDIQEAERLLARENEKTKIFFYYDDFFRG